MQRTQPEKSDAVNMHIVQNSKSNSKQCYIDLSNGSKFYSKPEVLRYFETLNGNSSTSKKGNRFSVMDSASEALVEGSTVEDLPPGWIKEVKTRKSGNGIQKNLQSAAKRQQSNQSASRQQLFAAQEIYDKRSSELLAADSSKKGQDVNVSAEMTVASVLTGETVAKMHSTANIPEIKEKSDPADVLEKNYIVNVMENANAKNHNNRSAFRNKKQMTVPHHFSRRLAGIEPNPAANTGVIAQDLQVPKRKLRESRITLEADTENKSSHWLNVVPRIEHGHHDSMDASQGELLNKCTNLSEGQEVYREPAHRLATEKIDDNKPEHWHSPAQDSSSPRLNDAVKAVKDELPAEDNPHASHGLASETTVQKDNELHMTSIGKSGHKICVNSKKSSNKKGHHIPSWASK